MRIRILVTGGTFDKEYDELNGRLFFKDSHLPEMLRLARCRLDVSVRTLMMIDSLDMTDADRRLVVESCRSCAEDRIVVTHGTDTMEETAYFLDLTVSGDRPVVVTGSMRPSDMPGADGPANLIGAIRAATDPGARGRGTLVLMDDRLFAARDVTKTNSTRVETFQAPERGALAIADPEGFFFHRQAPGHARAQFDIASVRELPRVDIVYSYAGADSVPIEALVAAGAKGIVLAGVGRGGATASQHAALDRAVKRGVIVVVSTRTGSGRVPVGDGDDFIGSGDLNPQKARVLLSLVLTKTSDPAEVTRYFLANQ